MIFFIDILYRFLVPLPVFWSYLYLLPVSVSGALPALRRGLQLREQCPYRPIGDRRRYSNRDCNQPGAFEEEAIWHHQSRHCRGQFADAK